MHHVAKAGRQGARPRGRPHIGLFPILLYLFIALENAMKAMVKAMKAMVRAMVKTMKAVISVKLVKAMVAMAHA